MPITQIDHYSTRTTDVTACTAFYAKALGFVPGPRPDFPFPGAWLYVTDAQGSPCGSALVHLIGIDPQDANGLSSYLGDKAQGQPQVGTGALDHIALQASDLAAMYSRLADNVVPFRERRVPGMALHQLFVEDPCGVTLELNYAAPQDLAVADARAQQG